MMVGFLPTQALGISVAGQIPSGNLGLNYVAEYGSSDTIRPDYDGGGAFDENNGNHLNVGLFLRPDAVPGLQVGGSFYHDRISDFALGPSVRLGQTIVNAHIVYVGHDVEFLNEGFLIRNAYEGTGPSTTCRRSIYNFPGDSGTFALSFATSTSTQISTVATTTTSCCARGRLSERATILPTVSPSKHNSTTPFGSRNRT